MRAAEGTVAECPYDDCRSAITLPIRPWLCPMCGRKVRECTRCRGLSVGSARRCSRDGGCLWSPDEFWGMAGADAARTFHTPEATAWRAGAGAQFRRRQVRQAEPRPGARAGWSAPVLAGGALFAADGDGRLFALSTADLTPRWREEPFVTGGCDIYSGAPAAAGDLVYVGSPGGWLSGYDLESGAAQAQARVNCNVVAPLGVAGDLVFYAGANRNGGGCVGCADFRLRGAPAWERGDLDSPVAAGVAVAADVAAVLTQAGTLYAFDLEGASRWPPLRTGVPVYGSLALGVGEARAYFGDRDGRLHAVDLATGREAWSVQLGSLNLRGGPGLSDAGILVGSAGTPGQLYLVRREDGRLLRSFEVNGQLHVPPAISRDELFLADSKGFVYRARLDVPGAAPEVVFHWETGAITTAMAVGDGALYLATSDGALVALEPAG